MEQHNFRHDIQRFLSGGAKKTKWRDRVIKYIMEATRDDRMQRMDRVAQELEWPIARAIMANRSYADLEVAAGDLLYCLNEQLLREGDIRSLLLSVKNAAISREELDALGSDAKEFVRIRGRARLMVEFLRLIGSSLDWSMNFALALTEKWAKHGGHKPLAVASFEEQLHSSGHGEVNALIMEFVMECTNAPVDKPEFKGWIERLVEGAGTSTSVSEVLESVLEITTFLVNTPVLETLEENASNPPLLGITAELEAWFKVYPNLQRLVEHTRRPQLLLAPPRDDQFLQWSGERKGQHARARERGERAIEWFESHRDEAVRMFEERCQAVMDRPRRGLRTGGLDHVDVTVAPLRNAGIRAVVLYPEGYTFPDTGVHILVRKETPALFTFTTELNNFELALHDEVVRHKMHFTHRNVLAEMLRFILIDILYRIVVGEKELREKKRWNRTGDENAEARAYTAVRRPRFRRLHEGWNASAEARERAITTLGWLPSDHTFVREHSAHYRGGELVYDLPTEPVAVYGDDDLFDMGDWS